MPAAGTREGDANGLLVLFVRATGELVGKGEGRFGIAVSGGPDSMALLDLAARGFPGRVAAATMDHGLRTESASEAAMVAHWCVARDIAHAILRPSLPPEGNVHAWAREQRYAALEAWRQAEGLDWLMTAHHADDQTETLLMRLNRGSGVGGLAGVRARAGCVIRPLLDMRKADLLAYARARELPFALDPSNADTRFDRTRMRSALAEAGWLDVRAAGRSAAALAEAEEALQWMVGDLAAAHVRQSGEAWLLDRTDLPRELLRRLLLHMLAQADPGASAPRGETLDRAIALAQAGRQTSLGRWLLKGGTCWTMEAAPLRRH